MELLKNNGFQFCPSCSSEDLCFKITSLQCKNCDFTYYQNTAAAVGIIISRQLDGEKEILLVVRAQAPAKGCYDLPGGFIDPGESLEQGIQRELTEELGNEICAVLSQPKYLLSASNNYDYKDNTYTICDVFFSAELQGTAELTAADDVESFVWCRLSEIKFEHVAFPSTNKALRFYQKQYS